MQWICTALLAADQHTRSLVGLYTASSASRLVAAGTPANDDTASWTGLHPGMVNEAVADQTVVRVKSELRAYSQLADALERQRDTDRSLLASLTQFLEDCPDGYLAQLRDEVTGHDATLDVLSARGVNIDGQLTKLDEGDTADSETELTHTTRQRVIERALDRLADLTARAEHVPEWREYQSTAERDAATAYGNADTASTDAQIKDAEAATARGEESAAKLRADAFATEASKVQYLDAHFVPTTEVDADPLVSLDILRQRRLQAQHAYEVRTADSVYAERVRALSSRVSGVQDQVDRLDAGIRMNAATLLASPEGQDSQRRTAAIQVAAQAVTDSASALGAARAALTAAEQRHEEARARRRDLPRRNTVPAEPTTIAEAMAYLAEWERRNDAMQTRRLEIEQAIETFARSKQNCESRTQVFTVLRNNLNLPDGVEPPQHAAPYPHSTEQAQADRDEVASWVSQAVGRAGDARDKLKEAVGKARTTGSRYPTVSVTAKDRLLHDNEDVLARNATALAESLQLRATTIHDELAGISRDQDIVATSLINLVKTTFDTLRKAERYSLLPSNLGAWSGQKMLRINFTVPASDADMRTYVNRVIDRRVNDGAKPEGMPLLKDAVHEVVGPRGFIVKVLKPSEDTSGTREDITRLSKWSGGEKLTVCVALYCTIAALRAANSGRRDRAGGVLLLDNPIGRASHGSLVKLQRAVAAHHKVQLIYTTGVKDPDAVSRFPNVIRLDNRIGRGNRSRRYIVEAQADTDPNTGHVDGIRVAHTDGANHLHVVASAEGSE